MTNHSEEAQGQTHGTILIVDDNQDVRRLLKKVLEMAGYFVLEAGSAEAAMKLVEADVPKLVLMDLRLPGGVSGLEATRGLKENPTTSRVPVIALTASVTEHDRGLALAAGCSGFIGKPIRINELPQMVEEFIRRGAATPR